MYIPAHFAMTTEQVADVLAAGRAGDLVTYGPPGLVATYVPMLHEDDGSDFGRLVGHLSLVNDQWRPAEAGEPVEAMFVLHGPDDYVEADWLSTPASPNVPTWNYVTVHAWGDLVVHRDPEWLLAVVRRLSLAHGDASVDAMEPASVDRLLRAIVGVKSGSPGWTARRR
ncbi:MAG: FMN-binding negative transcriptional regulator [Propionicimonas sp.]|uniref:FMN-binding negative transcriptional regulator n=1 Tax=Propionicimonas sp. TaxID=1955623 RepID=UPI003D09820D